MAEKFEAFKNDIKHRKRKFKQIDSPVDSPERLEESSNEELGFMSMPLEILRKIIGYLNIVDRITLRRVSKYLEIITAPDASVKQYGIYEYGHLKLSTAEVISDLKKMPLVTNIRILARKDVDEILKQIRQTNKNLEVLHIQGNLKQDKEDPRMYQRHGNSVLRILEECPKLHTLRINNLRLSGKKLFETLGEFSYRLKLLEICLKNSDYVVFIQHMNNLHHEDQKRLQDICFYPMKEWSTLTYASNYVRYTTGGFRERKYYFTPIDFAFLNS